MEFLIVFAPLFFGPVVFVYGLGQLTFASFQTSPEVVPTARVHTRQPAEEPAWSWRRRGRRNMLTGALLSAGLFMVFMALAEAARCVPVSRHIQL